MRDNPIDMDDLGPLLMETPLKNMEVSWDDSSQYMEK